MNAPRCAVVAVALVALLAWDKEMATAQEPTEISVGATVSGTLTSSDPAMMEHGPGRVYSFQAEEGQHLVATLRSGAFDAYLTLMRSVSGITDVIDNDDDSGGGSDARLRFVVPVTGLYYLVAQSYSEDETGGYFLTLEVAPPARPAPPQPIAVGDTRSSTLVADGPILYEGNSDVPYHLYTFQARAGQRLVAILESEDFDTFLAYGPMSGDTVEVTGTDDDSGGGTNALLRMSIPRDGTYGIHARPLGSGRTGAYSITLREAQVAAPRPLAVNREVQGVLGESDPDEEQKYFDQWLYTGAAGETIRIWLRSEDFDAYLSVGRMVGGVYQELDWNDDGGEEGTDSYLEITLPADGEYVIRATTFSWGSTGSYTLRVESVVEAAARGVAGGGAGPSAEAPAPARRRPPLRGGARPCAEAPTPVRRRPPLRGGAHPSAEAPTPARRRPPGGSGPFSNAFAGVKLGRTGGEAGESPFGIDGKCAIEVLSSAATQLTAIIADKGALVDGLPSIRHLTAIIDDK